MTDYLKTALLLEEKAARLPRDKWPWQRAYLLAMAMAARRLGIELASVPFYLELGRGHHKKRLFYYNRIAREMPDGSKKSNLECKVERLAICHIVASEGNDRSFDSYAAYVAAYSFPID